MPPASKRSQRMTALKKTDNQRPPKSCALTRQKSDARCTAEQHSHLVLCAIAGAACKNFRDFFSKSLNFHLLCAGRASGCGENCDSMRAAGCHAGCASHTITSSCHWQLAAGVLTLLPDRGAFSCPSKSSTFNPLPIP